MLDDFERIWKLKSDGAISLKDLLFYIPFVHSAYSSTYDLPRKQELFIPLKSGTSPVFRYPKKGKIRLIAELDKGYFKENWLIHEFLTLVLDQFMDEIACEIVCRASGACST